jgi:hypothetical protein
MPPLEVITRIGATIPMEPQAHLQVLEVAAHGGQQIGVHDCRAGALVLLRSGSTA